MKDLTEILEQTKSMVSGHFVFKAGYGHGSDYVNKENFPEIGAINTVDLINEVVNNAYLEGLDFGALEEVGVICPAYGALPYALTVAALLESYFPHIKFFQARTELKVVDGRKVHLIPEKLIPKYRGKFFIGFEDIVNNGTTIREIKTLIESKEITSKLLGFMCILNRNGQTAESLGVDHFYPYKNPTLKQFDIREAPCPLCQEGVPINTELGKGSEWVELFGQPPYPPDMDFSSFWQR